MAKRRRSPAELLVPGRALTLAGVADGAEGLIVADLARAIAARPNAPATSLLVICRDGPRMAQLARALAFFAPEIEINEFPGLGLPALRPRVAACRHRGAAHDHAVAARAPEGPRAARRRAHHRQRRAAARAGARPARDAIALGRARQHAGDGRRHQVARAQRLQPHLDGARAGDYAVRGGIIDLYPPGMGDPVRLDFFGDTLESIRTLRSRDAALDRHACARSIWCRSPNSSSPARPSAASAPAMSRRSAPPPNDPLYEAVSEGRRHPGMEHWLPLFHEQARHAVRLRAGHAGRARAARRGRGARAPRADRRLLRRAPAGARRRPRRHALQAAAAGAALSRRGRMDSRGSTRRAGAADAVRRSGCRRASMPARAQGRNFAPERTEAEANVFDAVTKHVHALQAAGKRVVIAMWSEGSRERMSHVLADHGLANLANVADCPDALRRPKPEIALAVLGLEAGFETARPRRHRRAGHSRRPAGAPPPRRRSGRKISSPR